MAGHLVSWGGLCPQMNESAGKRRSTRVHPSPQGRAVAQTDPRPILVRSSSKLVQAAWAAVRKRGTYLHARFLRLKARRGPMKAVVATAAKILVAIYAVLRDNVEYRDLGADHFDQITTRSIVTRPAGGSSADSRPSATRSQSKRQPEPARRPLVATVSW